MAGRPYCYHLANAVVVDVARIVKWVSRGELSKLWLSVYEFCRSAEWEDEVHYEIERVTSGDTTRINLWKTPGVDFKLVAGRFTIRDVKIERGLDKTRVYRYVVDIEPRSIYVTFAQPGFITVYIIEKAGDGA